MIAFLEVAQTRILEPSCVVFEEGRSRGTLVRDGSGTWNFEPERQTYSVDLLDSILAKLKELNP